jgi:hypothetical protein
MLQADSNLDQAGATAILTSTARHDSFTGAGWSPVYGAGKVDALAAVQRALGASHGPSPTPRPTSAPTSTPTQPSSATVAFALNQIRIQAKNRVNAAAIHSVKKGSRIYLYLYWHLNGDLTGAKPSYSFTATRGGKMVLRKGFAGSRSSYSTGDYQAVFTMQLNKVGTYVFDGRIGIGSSSRTGTTSVSVHK